MKRQICASMIFRADLRPETCGKQFLDVLSGTAPALFPDRVGDTEPITRKVDPGGRSTILEYWSKSLVWLRRPGGVAGALSLPFRDGEPSSCNVSCEAGDGREEQILALAIELSSAFSCGFGAITGLADPEIARGRGRRTVHVTNRAKSEYTFFVTRHDLKRGIPDLYWTTFLGAPYVDLLGETRIRATPVHSVTEIGHGVFALQLSASIHDLWERPDAIEAVRAEAMAHLGTEFFSGPNAETAKRVAAWAS